MNQRLEERIERGQRLAPFVVWTLLFLVGAVFRLIGMAPVWMVMGAVLYLILTSRLGRRDYFGIAVYAASFFMSGLLVS